MQLASPVSYHTNTTFGKTSQSKGDQLTIYLVFQWPALTMWVPAVKTIFLYVFRTKLHEGPPT